MGAFSNSAGGPGPSFSQTWESRHECDCDSGVVYGAGAEALISVTGAIAKPALYPSAVDTRTAVWVSTADENVLRETLRAEISLSGF